MNEKIKSDEIDSEIIYGLNDNPELYKKIIVAFEHLCSIIVPVMVPGYIICGAIGTGISTKADIISMCLLFSGIGTLIHAFKFKCFGSGMLSIQGVSFVFVAIFINVGKLGGLPLIFGMAFLGSFTGYIFAPLMYKFRRFFPPIVTGTVVIIIGFSLMSVAIDNCIGATSGKSLSTTEIQHNLLISLAVICFILIFQCFKNHILKSGAILWGIVIGFIVCLFLGKVDFSPLYSKSAIIVLPGLLKYGFSFSYDLIPIFIIAYLVIYMEAIGDFTATSMLSDGKVEGDEYNRRLQGGILGDTLTCTFGTLFGSFPTTVFAQNNGIIQVTGVASKKIARWIGIILILLGLFPYFSRLFSIIPQPVISGAMLMIFGIIVVVGIKVITQYPLYKREVIILAISLVVSLEFSNPEYYKGIPEMFKVLFTSPICMGGMVAFILNIILPKKM